MRKMDYKMEMQFRVDLGCIPEIKVYSMKQL